MTDWYNRERVSQKGSVILNRWMAERQVEKARAKTVPMRRGFDAAKIDRLTASWTSSSWSADQELRPSITVLRARARDLALNNDYVRKFLQMIEANVIGPSGFSLQMRITDPGGKPDQLANGAIEAAFDAWSRRGQCDVTGKLSFADLQRQLIRAIARDGEVLLRKVRGYPNRCGFALQVLDIDRLDHQLERDPGKGRNAIRMGIEIDRYGRPVAFHIKASHPGDRPGLGLPNEIERVPADELLHLYLVDRPEQRRGFPWIVSAMIGLNNLGAYQEAAIIAARIGASKMGFYQQDPEAANGSPLAEQDVDGSFVEQAEPGVFGVLPPGYTFESFNPDYPHANYDAFVKTSLRGIASGMGVAYHALANDLEGVSFSSIRSGTLEERDAWMTLQNWFAEACLYDVFTAWLECALLKGAATMPNGSALPAAKLDKFNVPAWQGRRWSWVDPQRDIEANRAAVALGIKSRRDVAAEMGYDLDDVLQQLKLEQDRMRELGLYPSTEASKPARPPKEEGD